MTQSFWSTARITIVKEVLAQSGSMREALEIASRVLGFTVTHAMLRGVFRRHHEPQTPFALLRSGNVGTGAGIAVPAAPLPPQLSDSRPVHWATVSRPSDAKRYLIIGDVHVPYEAQDLIRAVCDLVRDIKIQGLVILGDFLDFFELTVHNAGSVRKLEGKRVVSTFAAGNRVLDQLEAAAGAQCQEKHYIFGNHEDRVRRWLNQGDNAVFADDPLLDVAERLRLRERGWTVDQRYPKGRVKLGKLNVVHGRYTTVYHAAMHLHKYQANVLYGHCHTSQVYHGATIDGQHGGYGIGHLADPESEAMDYKGDPSNWINGCALVYVRPSGDFQVVPLNFVHGVLHFGDRMYGGRANEGQST